MEIEATQAQVSMLNPLYLSIKRLLCIKTTIEKEVAAEYYMRGVYENASVFYAGFFDYDTNIYAPILKSVNKSDSQNTLSVTIELQERMVVRMS